MKDFTVNQTVTLYTPKALSLLLGSKNGRTTGSLTALLGDLSQMRKRIKDLRIFFAYSDHLYERLLAENEILRHEKKNLIIAYKTAAIEPKLPTWGGEKIDWSFGTTIASASMRYVCLVDQIAYLIKDIQQTPALIQNFTPNFLPGTIKPTSIEILNNKEHPEWVSTYLYELGRPLHRLAHETIKTSKARAKS